MLGYIEIVLIFKKNLIFSIKARRHPAKKKLVGAKLRAVLTFRAADSTQLGLTLDFCNFFEKSTCGDLVSHKYSFL